MQVHAKEGTMHASGQSQQLSVDIGSLWMSLLSWYTCYLFWNKNSESFRATNSLYFLMRHWSMTHSLTRYSWIAILQASLSNFQTPKRGWLPLPCFAPGITTSSSNLPAALNLEANLAKVRKDTQTPNFPTWSSVWDIGQTQIPRQWSAASLTAGWHPPCLQIVESQVQFYIFL